MDRQTEARGKTICLPTLSGGDIMTGYVMHKNYNSCLHLESGETSVFTQKTNSSINIDTHTKIHGAH